MSRADRGLRPDDSRELLRMRPKPFCIRNFCVTNPAKTVVRAECHDKGRGRKRQAVVAAMALRLLVACGGGDRRSARWTVIRRKNFTNAPNSSLKNGCPTMLRGCLARSNDFIPIPNGQAAHLSCRRFPITGTVTTKPRVGLRSDSSTPIPPTMTRLMRSIFWRSPITTRSRMSGAIRD